jgi:hypothetical protein
MQVRERIGYKCAVFEEQVQGKREHQECGSVRESVLVSERMKEDVWEKRKAGEIMCLCVCGWSR